MNPIRLSICISTLNRGSLLEETLRSLMTQVCEGVEIILLDGGSTDDTPEIARRCAAECPQLRYIRLEDTSLGFDAKYVMLGQLAKGDYCWMFADDDIVRPGAVKRILDELPRGFSLIVVNAEVRDKELKLLLQSRRVRRESDHIYPPTPEAWNELFADTAMYLTYIGGLVVRRDLWNERESQAYLGSMFVHIALLFQKPLPGPTLLLADPWIVIRYGNALWTGRSFELWMFVFPQMIWSFPDLSDAAKNKVEAREPWRSKARLLMSRAGGRFTLKDHEQWIAPRQLTLLNRMLSHCIARFPVTPLNLLARFLVGSVLRKKPSMTLYDLQHWKSQTRR